MMLMTRSNCTVLLITPISMGKSCVAYLSVCSIRMSCIGSTRAHVKVITVQPMLSCATHVRLCLVPGRRRGHDYLDVMHHCNDEPWTRCEILYVFVAYLSVSWTTFASTNTCELLAAVLRTCRWSQALSNQVDSVSRRFVHRQTSLRIPSSAQ